MSEINPNRSKEMINKAISDYKEKIEQQKSHELVLSSYMVTKPWGHEIWLELNEFYAYKVIHMKEGFQSRLIIPGACLNASDRSFRQARLHSGRCR